MAGGDVVESLRSIFIEAFEWQTGREETERIEISNRPLCWNNNHQPRAYLLVNAVRQRGLWRRGRLTEDGKCIQVERFHHLKMRQWGLSRRVDGIGRVREHHTHLHSRGSISYTFHIFDAIIYIYIFPEFHEEIGSFERCPGPWSRPSEICTRSTLSSKSDMSRIYIYIYIDCFLIVSVKDTWNCYIAPFRVICCICSRPSPK